MNTPNYIVQYNNQLMVSFRPLHQRLGFRPHDATTFFKVRAEQLNLVEGEDFEKQSDGRSTQYLVTPSVAMRILDTVFKVRAKPVQEEIREFLADQPDPQGHSEASLQAPMPIMRIKGQAAVNVKDLFALLSKMPQARLLGWITPLIGKLHLEFGKDYVEYIEPKMPDQKFAHKGFIINLDAAIAIVDAQAKNKAKAEFIGHQLKDYRKQLAKLYLPGGSDLADFIGLPSTEEQSSAEASSEPTQASLFGESFEAAAQHEPAEEVIPESVKNPEEGGSDQNVEPETSGGVFTQTVENPTEAQEGVFRKTPNNPEPQPEPAAAGEPPQEAPDYQEENEKYIESQDPTTVFDLMVSFARGQLQQAETMRDLYRDMKATEGTVSALVGINQEAALRTLGLPRGKAEIPAQSMRDKIKHAVNKRAAITKESQESLFKHIYKRLYYDYGFSVSDYPRYKDETHLGLCERLGLLDRVWAIVDSREFNAYASRPAAANQ